ncbi:MAG TPA: SRPBCC family protein [Rhizomicrobium sp.]|jgi:uncharacterized protein YndB with AHSA1/START domain|nr:SRPBCC family protein [Rhizomicrobium sp.]
MSKTISIAPVRKTLIVAASQAHAFEVFTAGIDRWWPKGHNIGGSLPLKSQIEPRVGGRWYTLHDDGREVVVGHVRAWEPPSRFVFSWEISAEWKPDATVASEVEVLFVAEGPKQTRVTLEHRDFEALGAEGGEKMRSEVGSGWPTIMDLFKAEAEK